MDVERSAVLPKDPDISFPSPEKWRDITKRRSKSQATERDPGSNPLSETWTISRSLKPSSSAIEPQKLLTRSEWPCAP